MKVVTLLGIVVVLAMIDALYRIFGCVEVSAPNFWVEHGYLFLEKVIGAVTFWALLRLGFIPAKIVKA